MVTENTRTDQGWKKPRLITEGTPNLVSFFCVGGEPNEGRRQDRKQISEKGPYENLREHKTGCSHQQIQEVPTSDAKYMPWMPIPTEYALGHP